MASRQLRRLANQPPDGHLAAAGSRSRRSVAPAWRSDSPQAGGVISVHADFDARSWLQIAAEYAGTGVGKPEAFAEPVAKIDALLSRLPQADSNAPKRLEPGRFTIVMEEGVIKAVVSNDPTLVGAKFSILDYDIEDVDPVWLVAQGNGDSAPAGGYTSIIEKAGIDLEHIYEDPDSALIEDKTC